MAKFNPYDYNKYLGRCTSRDEYGNADIKGVDMTFLLGLHYEEMDAIQAALNRLADFEDAEEAADMEGEQNPCEDCISREKAIEDVVKCTDMNEDTMDVLIEKLQALSPVQPARRKGKWINTAPPGRSDNIVCDQCGYNSIADYDFCPKCGADMKGEQKMMTKPTGGCIKCAKCESVRQWYYCGQTKLTEKQLYNTKGCCKKFIPKASIKETEQNNETDSLEKALDGFKAFADYMWGKQKENSSDHIMQRFMRKE